MIGNTDVTNVTEQMKFYQTLGLSLLVIAIVFALIAIVFWFVLKIPHSIKVLTGMGVEKEIRKISSTTKTGMEYIGKNRQKAALSWNTSGLLNKSSVDSDETVLLSEVEATTVLDSDDEGTVLLSDINRPVAEKVAGFEIEDEIVITNDVMDKGINHE
ncbi:MAG: hypothetical protein II833_01375 [Pseudobutyrivibrio sp.]|nr:hypothetical protein [Pseudobutyrivibrio sp.]